MLLNDANTRVKTFLSNWAQSRQRSCRILFIFHHVDSSHSDFHMWFIYQFVCKCSTVRGRKSAAPDLLLLIWKYVFFFFWDVFSLSSEMSFHLPLKCIFSHIPPRSRVTNANNQTLSELPSGSHLDILLSFLFHSAADFISCSTTNFVHTRLGSFSGAVVPPPHHNNGPVWSSTAWDWSYTQIAGGLEHSLMAVTCLNTHFPLQPHSLCWAGWYTPHLSLVWSSHCLVMSLSVKSVFCAAFCQPFIVRSATGSTIQTFIHSQTKGSTTGSANLKVNTRQNWRIFALEE